jgi:hypothetical protein
MHGPETFDRQAPLNTTLPPAVERLRVLDYGLALLTAVAALWTLIASSLPAVDFGEAIQRAILWLVIATAWVVLILVRLVVGGRRSVTRRVVARWALALLTQGLVSFEVPLRVRLALSEGALTAVAQQVIANEAGPIPSSVGLIPVRGAHAVQGGMRFVVGDDFLDTVGFAYIPAGTPPEEVETDYEHLGGPWYVWRESF